MQVLADEGVDVMFGYSGGAILPVYDAVFRYNAEHPRADGGEPMPLVVPANEQGAGFMAAGYARASGKVGVAIVTSGPGATNMVTPVRDSMADSIPLVVICGQVANRRDRQRRVPGSAGQQHHGRVREARIPRHRRGAAGSHRAHRVHARPQRPARAGGGGRAEGRAERRADRSAATASWRSAATARGCARSNRRP